MAYHTTHVQCEKVLLLEHASIALSSHGAVEPSHNARQIRITTSFMVINAPRPSVLTRSTDLTEHGPHVACALIGTAVMLT